MAEPTKIEAKKGEAPTTEEFSRRAHELLDRLADQVANAEERLREAAAHTQQQASETAKKAQAKTNDAVDDFSDYVREHPLKSFGAAVLGGALIGMLLKR